MRSRLHANRTDLELERAAEELLLNILRLTPEQVAELRKVARNDRQSVAEVVQFAVSVYLDFRRMAGSSGCRAPSPTAPC